MPAVEPPASGAVRNQLECQLDSALRTVSSVTRSLLSWLQHREADYFTPGRLLYDTYDQALFRYLTTCFRTSATLLHSRFKSAAGNPDFGHCLEMAVLMKHAAQDVLAQVTALRQYEILDNYYWDILEEDLEEFRRLFVPWVATFDRTQYRPDSWSMFDSLLG